MRRLRKQLRMTMGNVRKAAVGAAALMLMLLTGCGGSMEMAAFDTMSNGVTQSMVTESYAEYGSFNDGYVEYSAATEEAKAAEPMENQVPDSSRKLIKTVNLNVETREFEKLITTVEDQVKALGGYIENMNTYNGSSYYGYGGTRNANMTIRIPKEQLDAFLDTVSGISNVVRRSESVEDVTLAYVDLESHKEALETEQDRLLELLKKAESIEDIITIESRLSDVRYQLESMESRLRTYDNQVDYSTVYLNVEEVEIYTPKEEESVWERIGGGFVDSLKDIGNGFVELCIWFVINIPYFVIWVVVIGFVILVIKRVRRRSKDKKQENSEQKGKEQTEDKEQRANKE